MIHFYRTRDSYGFLSNYFAAPIELDGLLWPTCEHYFQAQKFPADATMREAIRISPNPNEAKRIAWSSTAIRPDWDKVRDDVMRTALHAKFSQHEDLRAALLASGHTPIAEHTDQDVYWGDGGDGSGSNRMGELLADVRADLASQAIPGVNRVILNWLLQSKQIQIADSPYLYTSPPVQTIAWDSVNGMLLGLAIGDSLGNRSEGRTPTQRMQFRGEIRDFLPNGYAGMRKVGLPSDDSQMAFWTLEMMLADGGLVPESIAQAFSTRQIFGIGKSVRDFVNDFVDRGLPWYRAAQPSAGNGALMRIAPVLVPYVRAPSAELWADVALAAMVTHNDTASIASCIAFSTMLWDLLAMSNPPPQDWWRARFVDIVGQLELPTTYLPRSEHLPQEERTFKAWIDVLLTNPALPSMSTLDACEHWYSAAYLLETVPSALLILQRFAHEPEEAIVRAVNDTWDNDTVAAIVGAAVGALHGAEALPKRWRKGLLGRLGASDDGALFQLLDEAQACWD